MTLRLKSASSSHNAVRKKTASDLFVRKKNPTMQLKIPPAINDLRTKFIAHNLTVDAGSCLAQPVFPAEACECYSRGLCISSPVICGIKAAMKAVIVTYIVKKGREKQFEKVLKKHWKVLQEEQLTTNQAAFIFRDPENPTVYKEVFEWKTRKSLQKAEESDRVQKLWKQMMELTEEGGIEPAHFEKI